MSFVHLFLKPLRDPPFYISNVHSGIINFVFVIVIVSVSKPLVDLVNDASDSLEKICNRFDTPLAGLGNYEDVAKYYRYDVFTIQARFKTSPYGPSKALILAIIAEYPDVTIESFAKVVVKQTKREDVARLLRKFDCK